MKDHVSCFHVTISMIAVRRIRLSATNPANWRDRAASCSAPPLHRYDENYIRREHFGGVYGGAVIGGGASTGGAGGDDPAPPAPHLDSLLAALSEPPATERRGAAFFFHEHVTAILKNGNGGFDFVDSLPHSPAGVGVRIWCADIDALRSCLLWYTSSKFSEKNQAFIDSTRWDDLNCEFDPRVFQAYVWQTAP